MKTDFSYEFRNHKVTEYRDKPNEYLRWQVPGSSTCRIDFLVSGPFLIVVGDLGDAIFRWSHNTTLAWVAGCDDSYILPKCQASEVGRDFREWDMDTATEYLKRLDGDECYEKFDLQKAGGEGFLPVETQEEWREWLREDGHEYLGDDHELWDIGMIPHIRFRMQMDGLRRAVEAIASEERNPA